MKKIYLLLLFLGLTSLGFGQIVIDNPTFAGGNNGSWTPSNVTFPTTPAPGHASFPASGASTLTSPTYTVPSYPSITVSFDAAKLDTGPSVALTAQYSLNNGSTWITGVSVTPANNAPYSQSTFTVTNPGTSFKVRFQKPNGGREIGVRDVEIIGNCAATADPQAFSATAFSTSQINLGFTANTANNNTVIIFNTTNTFSAPTGPPPAVGSAFGGGTLLFNASGNGPFNHTGLNQDTTYYYRAYSYNGCSYSAGLSAQATTLCATTLDPQAFSATAVSSSQINLGYTANAANNNTVIVFNTTNIFTAPTGTPPAVGSAFGGGTLLFNASGNGTYNHTGLNQGTTYYYRAYSYNGCSYSSGLSAQDTTPCATTLNPQAFSATAILSSQINLGYTANAANNNTVIVFNTTNTFSAPTGTPPAVGSAFGGGTLLFNASGNGTFNHTGLIQGTTYYYRAYSYNGCSYSSGLSAQATTPCAATLNPQAFSATAISSSQINLGYTANAANNNTVIVFNTTNTFSAPTGTPPAVGSAFGGGTLLFNASGNGTFNHTGLTQGTTYYYRAYSYNGCSYSPGLSAQATTPCATTLDPQTFTATTISESQINLGYTANAANNNTIIVFNTTNTFSAPTGPPPAVGSAFGGGTLLFNAAGNGTFNHTGLNEGTTYYYRAYSYNGCSYSSGLSAQATTPCVTPIDVSALTPTAGNQQVTLNWTNSACFDEVLVVAKAGSAVTAVPTGDGSAYIANAFFGAGTEIAPDEFVVYKNVGTTVTTTNLTNGTVYHFRVYTRTVSLWSSGVATNETPILAYCASMSGDATFEYISRVRLNSIDHLPTDNGASTYSDFTAISTTLEKGSSYDVILNAVKGTTTDPESFRVWIDYNQDGDFDDLGELVLDEISSTDNTVIPVNSNFIVPAGIPNGPTRMRVSLKYIGAFGDTTPQTSCETFPFGEVEDYTVNIAGIVSYLFVSGTWIPSDPNGVATTSDNINVLLGDAVISSNTQIGNVNVNPFSSLTVTSGTILQVDGILDMESTNVNYSSLMADGTIIGTIRYDRHVNGGPGVGQGAGANDLISSPLVSNQNFGEFAVVNSNIRFDTRLPGDGGDSDNKVFGPFDKSSGEYLTWNSTFDAGASIEPGVGYRAASTDNGGFFFTGSVNQGTVIHDIQYSGPKFRQWNLVGNPYPAYINVGLFLNYLVFDDPEPDPLLEMDIRNVDLLQDSGAAIYGYDGDGSDGYTIWNLNTPTRNITPGQGFLIQAKESMVEDYDLTFTPSMRVIGNTDDFILGRMANPNNSHLKLTALIGSVKRHTDFYFNNNSSSGLDKGYDAAVYGNVAGNKAIYSRLVENSVGMDMGIQSLATSALGSDIVVPLGINVPSGQQVKVSISESDLSSNIEVYLEDTVTGTFTLLNNSDYIFTPSSNLNSNNNNRFFLRFSEQTLSNPNSEVNGLQIFTTSAPRALFIKGQLASATAIEIYDIQGRVVLSSSLNTSSNNQQVDVSGLSSGVYVVKLNNSTQQRTKKVILK